ncbi:MAG: glutathione peroxidase [Chloroflexi bacterium]|jgi:glutathione peroxidase|uniref:Glutathione peroxidase n=1 Tax=Candidatus Thermofonsia Clade 3 bacterium TaxID=2364212 RepID=A0A2M8QGQ5_9CHLR|nr:glutathione peroxidase [Candidatus Roseilinea sp. NK_OTU-006]PJF49001.1 MAG: glutathione peroxidase [Candidatus Thermofonsia Clade 3 bacterium]RMG63417.1 MAG: glutathione peroxidase [Chloroflexota bacterium]
MSTQAANILDETVVTPENTVKSLRDFAGDVLLIVNVASQCGYTPQYAGLQALYEKYRDRGFTVLAFPCNQFGGQEPGTMEEILTFCSTRYNVSFPVFNKIEVNGPNRAPLYEKLTQAIPPENIAWNFEKFLVGRDGRVLARFKPRTGPDAEELVQAIEAALATPRP